MSSELWSAIDRYIAQHLIPEDPALAAARASPTSSRSASGRRSSRCQSSLIDPAAASPEAVGVRGLHTLVAADARVSATTIQTVGAKGHDGFLFALVQ